MQKLSYTLLTILICFFHTTNAQNKDITNENIWKEYQFYSFTVNGIRSLRDGEHYTTLEKTKDSKQLTKYSYKNSSYKNVILSNKELVHKNSPISINDYYFNDDETKILIASDKESIYRYSSKAHYYIFDINGKQINKLTEGDKQMYATFSPNSKHVAFVRNNNLYIKDIINNKEIEVTKDGEKNRIINGASDWVYEEELQLVKAFKWSPDGSKIAFLKFDESNVKQWNLKYYDKLYPTVEEFKYPKAGEENSKVSIHVFDLTTGKTTKCNLSNANYEYMLRFYWSNDSKHIAIQTFNRLQNHLIIDLVHVATNQPKVIYEEINDKYIEIPTTIFLKNSNRFIITNEKNGFNHAYLYNLDGKLLNHITTGKFEITKIYGIDEQKETMYYQSTEKGATSRHIYAIKINGTNKKLLSNHKGVNSAVFSKTFKYFINTNSNANNPHLVTINNNKGKQLRVLQNNSTLKERLKTYKLSKKEFFTISINDKELNAWKIKPTDFDETKKYPLLLFVYGGDGRQTVMDEYDSFNRFWFQSLANKGYIIVSVDNRGTEGNGAEFRKCIYKQLGKYETQDQIEVAKHFATKPYIDGNRIGIFGWSFGGYLSISCLLKGNDVFKTAIAVAPVTNWRYYDNIYTERYMQKPQDNPQGYDDNSPINHVEKLKGNLLLIHGMTDDNVHFQNSVEMVNALIKANKQFTQFAYPNKNHGIYGGNTRLHLYNLMTNYLLEKL